MTNSYLFSIYYIPWMLVLLAIFILIPITIRLKILDKNHRLDSTTRIDIWRSILTFPTFIGGVGVSLTVFSLLLSFTSLGDESSINVLLPLSAFCALFVILTKISFSILGNPQPTLDKDTLAKPEQ